jgi:hypothetical protein
VVDELVEERVAPLPESLARPYPTIQPSISAVPEGTRADGGEVQVGGHYVVDSSGAKKH